MIKPEKLSDSITKLFNARIADEYTAQMFYRKAANWCANEGFYKMAVFFANEAVAEAEHAKGLQDYMTDWNIMPEIKEVNEVDAEYDSLLALIEAAYNLEHSLYEEYEDFSVKALKEGEVCVFDFLATYRKIQNDSVVEYSDKLALLKGCNTDKTSMLLIEEKLA